MNQDSAGMGPLRLAEVLSLAVLHHHQTGVFGLGV